MAKIIEFDLDGTLTNENDWNPDTGKELYRTRTPNAAMISLVKDAVRKGWTVIINTARKEHNREITTAWLAENDVPYHFLFFNKIPCTYRIDDVNVTAEQFAGILGSEE